MNNDMLICSTVILGGVCMTCCFIGHRKIKHKKELASRLRDSICYLLEQGVATFLFGDHSEFNTLCYEVVSELREVYPKIRRIHYRTDYPDADAYTMQFLLDGYEYSMGSIEISKAETVLSADIFERLKDIPLIDKYAAFQLLDDDWTGISIDLEMLQTEGFAATKKVDPNLVIKKKDGKDQEVQEGWVGHIIPFDLVQATLLSAETDELHGLESRLAEIPSEYESMLSSTSAKQQWISTTSSRELYLTPLTRA